MTRSFRSPHILAGLSLLALSHIGLFGTVDAQVITPVPSVYGSVNISDLFFERQGVEKCDGDVGFFRCPVGTCYTGDGGYIGCCTISSCAERTTCIPYTTSGMQDCDPNVGGCIICTNSELPFCATEYNVAALQYIMYCNSFSTQIVHSYANTVTASGESNIITLTSINSKTATIAPPLQFTRTSTTLQTWSTTDASETNNTSSDTSIPNATNTGGRTLLPTRAIIGISVGCGIAFIAVLAFLFLFFYRRSRRHHRDSKTPFTIIYPAPRGTPPSSRVASKQFAPSDIALDYSAAASAAAGHRLTGLSELPPPPSPPPAHQYAPYPTKNPSYPSLSQQRPPPGSADPQMSQISLLPSSPSTPPQPRYKAYNPALHSPIITNPDPPPPAHSSRRGTPRPVFNPHHLSVVSELDVYSDDSRTDGRETSMRSSGYGLGGSSTVENLRGNRLSAQGALGYQSAEEALARGLRYGNYPSP